MISDPDTATRSLLESSDTLVVLHNSMHDLETLHKWGIHPRNFTDTMIMAYLLGDLPQGLKPLAYRLCGMKTDSYEAIVGPAMQDAARQYLEVAAIVDWPTPEPVIEFPGGELKIRKPQNIGRKIKSLLKRSADKDIDYRAKWSKMEGTDVVERQLGPMTGADLRHVDDKTALTYACRDADATLRCYHVLRKRIAKEGLESALNIDTAIIPMVLEMQRNGVLVDLGALEPLGEELGRKMDSISAGLESLLGYYINPGSPDQVAEMVIKERLPIKVKLGKRGKQSTAAEYLKPLRGIPIIDKIVEWREVETLKSMFVDSLPPLIAGDGYLRPTINTTRTATGRLSVKNPNLQNIPVRSEQGRIIRDTFITEPGWTFMSADFSQIELRVLAHESKDQGMINAFLSGADLHTTTASEMFGVPMDKVDEMKHRRPAKTVNFGIPYGITASGLFNTMEKEGAKGWSEASCQGLIDRWFSIRPGVKRYMDNIKTIAMARGEVRDMFGRRRWVYEALVPDRKLREEGLREAMNMPIQSGAQGIIKVAMAKIWSWLVDNDLLAMIKPWMQIHDSLEFVIRDDDIGWAAPVILNIMETAVQLAIPTPVDAKYGKRWGSMKKGDK